MFNIAGSAGVEWERNEERGIESAKLTTIQLFENPNKIYLYSSPITEPNTPGNSNNRAGQMPKYSCFSDVTGWPKSDPLKNLAR